MGQVVKRTNNTCCERKTDFLNRLRYIPTDSKTCLISKIGKKYSTMKKSNPNKWLKIKPECILIVQFKGLYVDIIAIFNKGIYLKKNCAFSQ